MNKFSLEDIENIFKDLSPPSSQSFVLYTGLYGMYNYEFVMGGIGYPTFGYYMHPYNSKYWRKTGNIIYISIGNDFYGRTRKHKTLLKHSPYKAKIRMWKDVTKIELFYCTKSLGYFNNFDSVNNYLKTWLNE